MKKIAVLMFSVLALSFTSIASAHVDVSPDSATVAKTQIFSVSVPNEKDNPTIGLKLVLPESLKEVTPLVKNGWKISIASDSANMRSIVWAGGNIPSNQLDTFEFSAQTPAKEQTLVWRAYQTYASGEVVSWDADPILGNEEAGTPYSTTKVINDLASPKPSVSSGDRTAFLISTIALLFSGISLGLHFKKK